jgi:hypothetical protein
VSVKNLTEAAWLARVQHIEAVLDHAHKDQKWQLTPYFDDAKSELRNWAPLHILADRLEELELDDKRAPVLRALLPK